MNRKQKTWLIACISILVILGGFGGYFFYRYIPAHWNMDDVQISLPFEQDSQQYIYHLQGWGQMTWGDSHNGIDFDFNESVEIIAWCDLRITSIETRLNEDNGCWQTTLLCAYNWKYRFDLGFETWASTETIGLQQEAAFQVKPGQTIAQGDSIGMLLRPTNVTHLHFGIEESRKDVCPYGFLTQDAQSEFDALWALWGPPGEDICSG